MMWKSFTKMFFYIIKYNIIFVCVVSECKMYWTYMIIHNWIHSCGRNNSKLKNSKQKTKKKSCAWKKEAKNVSTNLIKCPWKQAKASCAHKKKSQHKINWKIYYFILTAIRQARGTGYYLCICKIIFTRQHHRFTRLLLLYFIFGSAVRSAVMLTHMWLFYNCVHRFERFFVPFTDSNKYDLFNISTLPVCYGRLLTTNYSHFFSSFVYWLKWLILTIFLPIKSGMLWRKHIDANTKPTHNIE